MKYLIYRFKANGFRATLCEIHTDNIEETRKQIFEQHNTNRVLLYYETNEPYEQPTK